MVNYNTVLKARIWFEFSTYKNSYTLPLWVGYGVSFVSSLGKHCNDFIMSMVASQITNLKTIYSTVYSRRRSKKTSRLCVTGLCAGNSPVTGEFPAQRASKAENVSIWWRHHEWPLDIESALQFIVIWVYYCICNLKTVKEQHLHLF